jgi:hypothetical protein
MKATTTPISKRLESTNQPPSRQSSDDLQMVAQVHARTTRGGELVNYLHDLNVTSVNYRFVASAVDQLAQNKGQTTVA